MDDNFRYTKELVPDIFVEEVAEATWDKLTGTRYVKNSDRWQWIVSDSEAGVYFDTKTIRRSGNFIYVWLKMVYAYPQNGKAKSVKLKCRLDTYARTASMGYDVAYSAAGNRMKVENLHYKTSQVVVPASRGETILRTCQTWVNSPNL